VCECGFVLIDLHRDVARQQRSTSLHAGVDTFSSVQRPEWALQSHTELSRSIPAEINELTVKHCSKLSMVKVCQSDNTRQPMRIQHIPSMKATFTCIQILHNSLSVLFVILWVPSFGRTLSCVINTRLIDSLASSMQQLITKSLQHSDGCSCSPRCTFICVSTVISIDELSAANTMHGATSRNG
jgi:hypothetical protein